MNEDTINQTLLYKYVKKLYPTKARQIMQDNSNNLGGFINMEKLSTIQKREKLNDVFLLDEKGNGGANHKYSIVSNEPVIESEVYIPETYGIIQFQNGARKLENSIHGILDTDLLEIVRHRLQCFQKGDFASRDNAVALTHIEEALMWMNRRVEDRIERSVLGTNNK